MVTTYKRVEIAAEIPAGTQLLGKVKITDGTNNAVLDTDDASIAGSQVTLVVINLNYVWDTATSKWIRMTQPT